MTITLKGAINNLQASFLVLDESDNYTVCVSQFPVLLSWIWSDFGRKWRRRGRDVGEFSLCCVAVFYFNGVLSSVRLFFCFFFSSLPRSVPRGSWPSLSVFLSHSVLREAPTLTHAHTLSLSLSLIHSGCCGHHILDLSGLPYPLKVLEKHPVGCNETRDELDTQVSVSRPLCPSLFILTYWLE